MINKASAEKVLKENILPFWKGMIDNELGGFYGEADFYGKINKNANKGCILNSRILWTFSAACRLLNDNSFKDYAAQAFYFMTKAFYDNEHGGLYWQVDYKGDNPNTRKQFYNIAFGVYALSEYYLATEELPALDLALELFDIIEKFGRDIKYGGYIEAAKRDWTQIGDFRLSPKEINCPKSMNTCLHILEAWTNLVKACAKAGAREEETRVRMALTDILRVTLEKIVNKNYHFNLFFDMEWNPLSKEISYGHDIEGAWLMHEAALATSGNEKLVAETKQMAIDIASVIHKKAIDGKNGGLISACDEKGNIQQKKEWWPQAEAVVGFYNAYQLSGEQKYLDAANNIWEYIQNHFIDNKNGEWHNELFPDNAPDASMPKAGFWKCPYHNARACFEIIRRTGN